LGLNDELEKLRQAEEWLMNCEIGSQQHDSAWEHVIHVYYTSKDPALVKKAGQVIKSYEGA
jgi:hypothetical protein